MSQMVIGHTGEVTGPIVPIGHAVGDKEVLLRDEQGQISAAAGAGEFVIRSRYMALGYLDRPDLTAAVFLADPTGGEKQLFLTGDFGLRSEDGLLVHLGRKDSTVKIRGQRVELGAVEQAVRRGGGVKDAAVEVREDAVGGKYLAAYVVLDESTPNPSVLRAQLRLQLPSVMVPSQFVVMEAMPQTISGKVDRRMLPDPALIRDALPQPYVAARNDAEAVVLEAVEEVLARGPIGVLDDFRDLGLDSVSLFRLWLRLEEGFKQELPLGTLPEPPTVENIAVLVQQSLAPLPKAP
ncbi:MAG: non-ribosomal peptide synthetase [Anaerolineales bacterium]|nr:non-ribosomal peptide synthetase [Anaerolineales bacterium]